VVAFRLFFEIWDLIGDGVARRRSSLVQFVGFVIAVVAVLFFPDW
jgi:hypothetical protein